MCRIRMLTITPKSIVAVSGNQAANPMVDQLLPPPVVFVAPSYRRFSQTSG
jgi:hypothetical protein